MEVKYLKERCAVALKQYYDSKNHQKKHVQSDTSRFQDFRRDLQAVIGTRTNLNIAQIEDYGGETFVSEELAITILQESKTCFQRCQVVRNLSVYFLIHRNEGSFVWAKILRNFIMQRWDLHSKKRKDIYVIIIRH